MLRGILTGAAAGAAGTTALNAVTYLDMAVRGRRASSTPEESVERTVAQVPADVPGQGERRSNRVQGIAALLGLVTGVSCGAVYGAMTTLRGRPSPLVGAVMLGAGAMLGANAPMAGLGVSDPRGWDATGWLSDLIPHAAYGIVTAWTFDALQTR